MKRIDIINDFTNTFNVRVKVQDMSNYKWLFDQDVPRSEREEVVNMLKEKYPDYQLCEYIL